MSSPISRLSPLVILTGVRRQPNGVEGSHHRHVLREVSGFFSSNRGHKGRPKKWLALLEMTIGTDDDFLSTKAASLRGTKVRPCVPPRVTTVTYQNVPAP
jgi:hypothetical protein